MPASRRWAQTLLATVFVFGSMASSVEASVDVSSSDVHAAGSNAFALDLFRRLAPGRGNLFFSPWSVRAGLGMAFAGARTGTQSGMIVALRNPLGQSQFHVETSRVDATLRAVANRSGTELMVANAIWVARGLQLEPAFVDTVVSRYSGTPSRLDFARSSAAREIINSWVAEQTRGKIHDLIPNGTLSRHTRLVLTNAVYFQAAWEDSFNSRATSEAAFHMEDGQTSKVPFMHMDHTFRIMHGPDVQVLELPYKDGDVTMLIILPRDAESMADLASSLNVDSLASWGSHMRSALVRVALPKFRLESAYELSRALTAMGMGDAFDPTRADFSGISSEHPLFLSKVFHKAYVKVDERGTEASAATAIITKQAIASSQEPIRFIADHPFLIVIRSRSTGAILFMGRMADPT